MADCYLCDQGNKPHRKGTHGFGAAGLGMVDCVCPITREKLETMMIDLRNATLDMDVLNPEVRAELDHWRKAGFHHLPMFLDQEQQQSAIDFVRAICKEAPLVYPRMPNGTPMSVRITNAGPLGWWSDENGGYRYTEKHPTTKRPWPDAPKELLDIGLHACWQAGITSPGFDCVAINWYEPGAKLGRHVDKSEQDLSAPIVSVSLGDDAEFIMAGPERDDPAHKWILQSGDVCVMVPPSRNWYHSVHRILPAITSPLPKPGRLNLTIRKVT